MSNIYHDPSDLNRLKDLSQAAPNEFKAWLALDQIVAKEDGAISRKYRELIALAVAHTTQCVYCIDVHVAAAKRAGASRAEVAEAIFVAAAIRAGGAAAHGGMTMKLYDRE
ncbi:carboxymuconolactone decarboxylase family protein [Thiobacillus thioparus]|uniref:carboxymuconolactone decarboxylase family protein n=1 Tax=Thiobacillus thioparus TaxID=931 RepID=UPI0004756E24|nr:carboxymuconolactone decarboxylase family protein [Thiobacillus thioparus]